MCVCVVCMRVHVCMYMYVCARLCVLVDSGDSPESDVVEKSGRVGRSVTRNPGKGLTRQRGKMCVCVRACVCVCVHACACVRVCIPTRADHGYK